MSLNTVQTEAEAAAAAAAALRGEAAPHCKAALTACGAGWRGGEAAEGALGAPVLPARHVQVQEELLSPRRKSV